jgi:hypothetical protein
MERAKQPYHRELTGIHINLDEQAIEFEDRHGTIGRLVFGHETVLYEGQPLLLAPTSAFRSGAESAAPHPRPDQRRRRPPAPRPSPDPSANPHEHV